MQACTRPCLSSKRARSPTGNIGWGQTPGSMWVPNEPSQWKATKSAGGAAAPPRGGRGAGEGRGGKVGPRAGVAARRLDRRPDRRHGMDGRVAAPGGRHGGEIEGGEIREHAELPRRHSDAILPPSPSDLPPLGGSSRRGGL